MGNCCYFIRGIYSSLFLIMIKIYKITNNINNKVYIGKTNFSLKKRFSEHCHDAGKENKQHRPLYNAMSKYGCRHFHIELIEECSLELSEERERYWIDQYNTFHNGYNATLGGDGPLLYNHQQIVEMLLETPSPAYVAGIIGCSPDIIYPIAEENGIKTVHLGHPNPNKRRVYAYDKDGEFVAQFESTVEAAEWCYKNGKSKNAHSGVRSHISECARGKRKSAYGYIWQ